MALAEVSLILAVVVQLGCSQASAMAMAAWLKWGAKLSNPGLVDLGGLKISAKVLQSPVLRLPR